MTTPTPNTQHPHPMTTTTNTKYITIKLTTAEYAEISIALMDAKFAHAEEASKAEADGRYAVASYWRRREAEAIRAERSFELGLFDNTRHHPTPEEMEAARRRAVPTTPDGWARID